MKKTCKISFKFFIFLSFLFIAHCTLFIANCEAQPSITWQRTYDGPNHINDVSWRSCNSTENTYFIVGLSTPSIYVLRINGYGDTLWSKSINSPLSNSSALCVASSGDGGCVLSGLWRDSGNIYPPFTIKIDSNSNIIWNKTYPGDISDVYDIKKTLDGGYICCGSLGLGSLGHVFKINSQGNLMWQRVDTSQRFLEYKSIELAISGGYVILGIESGGALITEAVAIRIDDNGKKIWVNKYSINGRNTVGSCIRKLINGYAITGTTDTVGGPRIFIMKIDTLGDLTFSKKIYNTYYEFFKTFEVINPNKYLFSTWFVKNPNFQDTIFANIFYTDSVGDVTQNKLFSAANGDIELNSVMKLSNNDLIFSGFLKNDFTHLLDFYIVRTDSVFYSNPIEVEQISSIIPKNFKIYNNYPNPFNPQTTIKFDVPFSTQVTLKVFDLLGREVWSYTDVKTTGNYSVHFDGSNLASGVYFYRLEAGKFVESKKMVLLK